MLPIGQFPFHPPYTQSLGRSNAAANFPDWFMARDDDSNSIESLSRVSSTDVHVGVMVSMLSILTHTVIYFDFYAGLRDLVLNVNSQTQAALASLQYSIQNISSDFMSLREQMRRAGLKKKKVCVQESAGTTTIS